VPSAHDCYWHSADRLPGYIDAGFGWVAGGDDAILQRMASLSPDQLFFLQTQNIPLSSLFDASGMRTADYQAVMKAEGKSFAYGVAPCGSGGHTLRTRRGHCIECDHARIAFMLRHDKRAYVYIAASYAGKLIKIGSSGDVADRTKKLCEYLYGGYGDWQVLSTAATDAAGRIECNVHSRLAQYSVAGEYIRAGHRQNCYELFRCDFSDARDALLAALGSTAKIQTPNEARAESAFKFR
jgi:hypothetical protein